MRRPLNAFTAFVALCYVAAILFALTADNADARATAGLLFLPCLGLAVVAAVGWLIWAVAELRQGQRGNVDAV